MKSHSDNIMDVFVIPVWTNAETKDRPTKQAASLINDFFCLYANGIISHSPSSPSPGLRRRFISIRGLFPWPPPPAVASLCLAMATATLPFAKDTRSRFCVVPLTNDRHCAAVGRTAPYIASPDGRKLYHKNQIFDYCLRRRRHMMPRGHIISLWSEAVKQRRL